MFEIMMQFGGYRIDYLNLNAAHQSDAIGFYACGRLDINHRYSQQARHNLLAGLHWITCTQNLANLVAVYLDVYNEVEDLLPGRQKLIEDILSGMFTRVVISLPAENQENDNSLSGLSERLHTVDAIELICIEDSFCFPEMTHPAYAGVN